MPLLITLLIELIKMLPSIITAIRNDPNEDNKISTKVVLSRIKQATVGEAPELKNI